MARKPSKVLKVRKPRKKPEPKPTWDKPPAKAGPLR